MKAQLVLPTGHDAAPARNEVGEGDEAGRRSAGSPARRRHAAPRCLWGIIAAARRAGVVVPVPPLPALVRVARRRGAVPRRAVGRSTRTSSGCCRRTTDARRSGPARYGIAVVLVVGTIVLSVSRRGAHTGSFERVGRIRLRAAWLLLVALVAQLVLEFVDFPEARVDDVGFALLLAHLRAHLRVLLHQSRLAGMRDRSRSACARTCSSSH